VWLLPTACLHLSPGESGLRSLLPVRTLRAGGVCQPRARESLRKPALNRTLRSRKEAQQSREDAMSSQSIYVSLSILSLIALAGAVRGGRGLRSRAHRSRPPRALLSAAGWP